MVAGQKIDIDAVETFVAPTDLIIAHNAGFDSPLCEALSRVFCNKAWACSNGEIDWSAPGFDEAALADELDYLRREIYRHPEADPSTKYLTAFDRFRA